ncbi:MAG: hypothetical protein WC415_03425 [Patescibacteria group bacterium]|jgi:hypothetical protein
MEKETKSFKKAIVILIVAVVLAVAGGSFYGGMVFGKSSSQSSKFPGGMPSNFSGAGTGNFSGRAGGTGVGGGMVSGEVTGVIGDSVVVQQRDGSKKTIDVSGATVSKMTEGSISDIIIGGTVSASGATDSTSGDFSAKTVQIRTGQEVLPGFQGGRPEGQ